MRILFCFFLALCATSAAMAQTNAEPYARDWKKVDSLLDRGLPESAEKIIRTISDRAAAAGQEVQTVKAGIYLLRTAERTEGGDTAMIRDAARQAQQASFPANAIWHSITAQLYWNYYQQNRWQILQRTPLSGSSSTDISEWDAPQFFRTIGSHYRRSLENRTGLEAVNIENWDPILEKGVNTRPLRPSLYDLLAFRALEFFTTDEQDITKPAFQFEIDRPAFLDAANAFAAMTIGSRDSASLQAEALRIYQHIIRTHANDSKPDALIDADLHRLEFVYNHAVFPDKRERYRAALKRIADAYPGNATAAIARFRMLELDYNETVPAPGDRNETPKPSRDAVAIRAGLLDIVSRFPKSGAASLATVLLEEVNRKELSGEAEETVLPGEASRMLLRYRNIPEAFFRVVKVDPASLRRQIQDGQGEYYKTLIAAKPEQAFRVALPATADLEAHTTEVKIDPLPYGAYAILFSANAAFSDDNNAMSFALVQSTSLAVVKSQTNKKSLPAGFVLDRKAGTPVSGAEITFYTQSYNRTTSRYDFIAGPVQQSAADGSFRGAAGRQGYSGYSVRKGADNFFSNDYIYSRESNAPEERTESSTVFFTDRSIYRPGQTIWFKGISMRMAAGSRRAEVVSGQKTTVTFYDVNNQKVAAQQVTTNEFGSFAGSFVAPQGVLTGSMRISNDSGSVYFSVEEYKRPKFFAEFDTVKDNYALGQQVTIRGTAEAYAGNNIDGATVKYRVVRQARWPFWGAWWRPAPRGATQEIAKGTVTTDEAGKFSFSFPLMPDKTVDTATQPVFTYTVYADVTDAAGETRSASTVLTAGYRSLQIDAGIPARATLQELDTVRITTKNLSGAFTGSTILLDILPLQQPAQLLRARLWQKPDQQTMSEREFRLAFPLDEYADESKPQGWAEGKATYHNAFSSTPAGDVVLPRTAFPQNGWYVFHIETKDREGHRVSQKHYVQVWDGSLSGKVATPLAAFGNTSPYAPGEKLSMDLVTGFDQLHVQQVESVSGGKDVLSAFGLTAGNAREVNRTISEEERGGLVYQWFTVKNNRVYLEEEQVAIPWTNKDLEISWATHRDKLLPGAKETWTMTVKGPRAESVTAEMMAGLYDASLDAFQPHSWSMLLNWASVNPGIRFYAGPGFGLAQIIGVSGYTSSDFEPVEKRYDAIRGFVVYGYGTYAWSGRVGSVAAQRRGEERMIMANKVEAGNTKFTPPAPVMAPQAEGQSAAADATAEEEGRPGGPPPGSGPQEGKDIPLRTNLQETAFFFPQLKTDAQGAVSMTFTMPEALTEWKFLTLAHTKDLKTGTLTGTVKTQKDLMVQPGLPRFFRQGDKMTIATKIANLSTGSLRGNANLDIIDPATGKSLNSLFGLTNNTAAFSAEKDGSTTASWSVTIPQSRYEPVAVRISAAAGSFTDGEENILPVLSNRTMVTETLPLWMNGPGTKSFTFPQLRNIDSSKTVSPYSLTVEYTANPAWYALQALPYLMEYPYECAEQTFNRYYANALAAHILDKAPKLKAMFREWETKDTAALRSNLQKNQELKSALLEETPWVLEAKSETDQKHRIGQLFNAYKVQQGLNKSLRQLADMQTGEGAFPWFKGMGPDRYITQYIVAGLGRLQKLGIKDGTGAADRILQNALSFLDREAVREYNALVKSKAKMSEQHISPSIVHYLYARSFFKTAVPQTAATAYKYFAGQAKQFWPSFNPYGKGMIALALHRAGDAATTPAILQSLRETSVMSEEMGRYWKALGQTWWWYEAPIEAQSMLIETFTEAGKDSKTVNELKRWLLKQKQTQNWESTRATADACYALLLQGADWLSETPGVQIGLGDRTIRSSDIRTEAGTGYFKVKMNASEISSGMEKIEVTTSSANGATGSNALPSWGAVYYQYFEDFDKVKSASTPLSVERKLFIERNGDRGPELAEINAGNPLKVGDKVTIRIVLRTDRDMEYVHLKDGRAAAFEPVDVISGYRWKEGLGYYQSTRDASTNFFIDYLRKGTYVFTYSVFVTAKGDLSAGIATAQCMYAPEFSAHSAGARVEIR